MSNFFIDRPIFTWVLAIIIMLAGAISLYRLPIAQYPSIAPTRIDISAAYPGASAKTIEETVVQLIEQNMKGLDNLLYMESTSSAVGAGSVALTFASGTNPDIAQVQVQNKLQLVMPSLPETVQRLGVEVNKSAVSFLSVIGLVSKDGSMDSGAISDYLSSRIQDPISRIPGVGEITVFGAQYAMRIWADPDKFKDYKLMPSDVIAAINAQNTQVPGGQLGEQPVLSGQEINITITSANLLQTVEDFENIILRTQEDGSALYLRDVARIEINSESFNSAVRYMGKPAGAFAIHLASGANALATQTKVEAELENLSKFLPEGLEFVYPFDSTPFVRIAINDVFKTLAEAVVLVFFVMYLFLQNFRSTLIPTIAIPVVLLGTFAVLELTGFSINTLTMFGMVLSIGLLVDDAIVVVENVERLMAEEHLSPKEAAKKSMMQIHGALVGIGLALSAVFVPMSFFDGSAGVIYRQFSITIVSSMVLSVLVALTLTPMLCAYLLKPHTAETALRLSFFQRFNIWFERVSERYGLKVHNILLKPFRYLFIYGACIALALFIGNRLPSSFFPDEDQGILFVMVQLPPTSTINQTEAVLEQVEEYFRDQEKETVANYTTVSGFSFAGSGQNAAVGFIQLKPWDVRQKDSLRVNAIVERATRALSQIKEANVFVFAPPAVMELGNASGFQFVLTDMAGLGHEALMKANEKLLYMVYVPIENVEINGKKPPQVLTRTYQNGLADVDQLQLSFDTLQASAHGVSPSDTYQTLAAFWGGQYVNDFLDHGRIKRVYLQADAPFRMQAQDFHKYHVRSQNNEMTPVSNFISWKYAKGSPALQRFNGNSALYYQGEAAPGFSSGEAMDVMAGLVDYLPEGFGYAWTGLSFQEKLTGAQAPALFLLSITVVFLCLAALYESWSIPFSVLLIVPLGVMGALMGTMLRGLTNDIYFQVGLLAVMGLSAKNAILIVEFAKDLYAEGESLLDATLHAVRLRLRPIIMTSLAFILGVLPLAISTGAGSGGQNAIGTAVVAGTLVATFLGLFFTPLFFYLIVQFLSKGKVEAKGGKDMGGIKND